jgi:molybdenum cofactor cytidylyltransferase
MTLLVQMSNPRDKIVRSVAGSGRIVAILLAAGRSQRMRNRNKLLMGVGGRPMVRRAAETLLESHVREVIAVLGYDRARVAAAIAGLPLRIVVNDEYDSGQMSSVRAGIAAIADDPAAIVIALADQPALEPVDIDFLIDAFLAQAEPKILVPAYDGQRGNPIVLPGTQRRALQEGGVNFGCRNLIERHPETVIRIEVPNPHYVQDIDTPAAYDAWTEAHLPHRAKRA